jgi:hypothetical protein
MPAIKSESNQPDASETLSDTELIRRLDHLDEIAHRTQQQVSEILEFISEHKPALARGLSLMDPGAGLRKLITGKGAKH